MAEKHSTLGSRMIAPAQRARQQPQPDYWAALAAVLGLSEGDSRALQAAKSLVRAGVYFHIVPDEDAQDIDVAQGHLSAGLAVSLPLRIEQIAPDHLLRLLQSNALMAQTLGLVFAAGPVGELMLVSTLSTRRPHEMAAWIDAAAWQAQNVLVGASAVESVQ
jgi:hypothetical protein